MSLVAQDFQYVVVLMDGVENNVANSRKVEQPSRYYFKFLFELCCRVLPPSPKGSVIL